MKTTICSLLILLAASLSTTAQDSASYYHKKGLEEKTNRRYLVAAGHFDKAIQFNPKYINAYIENGYVNLLMRRTDAAMRNFNKVTELEPKNSIAISELMQLYYDYHQYQKAIGYAQKCTACNTSLRIIGMSRYSQEEYTEAEGPLKIYLQKNANDAEATYALAKTYGQIGQMQKAVLQYAKAIEIDPNRNIWMYELATAYYDMGDFKNAVVYFNKAAENGYPKNNGFKENLGFSYLNAGDFDAGEKILLDLVSNKTGNNQILRLVVDAYYQRKNYDRALSFCQKILDTDVRDAKALYQAGLCFQKKGQTSKGQQMCDKAIEMDPSLSSLRQQKNNLGL